MTEIFYLGSTGFAQVGNPEYHEKQKIEADVLMDALQKEFGARLSKTRGRLQWKANPHDFGTYHEMVFLIPEEYITDAVMELVSDMECFDWDNPDLEAEMEKQYLLLNA